MPPSTLVTAEQYARSGPTADPNDPDSDGDGMLDGVESLFAVWNATLSIWTLNPLVAGDGGLDSDADGLADRLELTLADAQPENGGSPPVDAPLLHVDAALQTNPIDQQIRAFSDHRYEIESVNASSAITSIGRMASRRHRSSRSCSPSVTRGMRTRTPTTCRTVSSTGSPNGI